MTCTMRDSVNVLPGLWTKWQRWWTILWRGCMLDWKIWPHHGILINWGRDFLFIPTELMVGIEYVLVIWDSRYYGKTRPKIKPAWLWLRQLHHWYTKRGIAHSQLSTFLVDSGNVEYTHLIQVKFPTTSWHLLRLWGPRMINHQSVVPQRLYLNQILCLMLHLTLKHLGHNLLQT